jgi:hypothetical protein
MARDPQNTYTAWPSLVKPLPGLVRKQRTQAKKVAALAVHVEKDKALRCDIEALLKPLGFASNEGVTCNGYDVKHNERKGNTTYDVVLLGQLMQQKLVDLGMSRVDIGQRPNQEVINEGYLAGKTLEEIYEEAGYYPGAETWVVEAIAAVRSTGETSYFATVNPMKGATVRQ